MTRVDTRAVAGGAVAVATVFGLVTAAVLVPGHGRDVGPAAGESAVTSGPARVSHATGPQELPPAPAATTVPSGAVLPGLDPTAPLPSPAVLGALLTPLVTAPALGGGASVDVVDTATGQRLASRGAAEPQVAASTVKLLTAAAALSLLGPGTTVETTVVDGATTDEVVLVGGGDVLLAAGRGNPAVVNGHAGLRDLAEQTATALLAAGRTSVAVRLDDSLFSGPTTSPTWGGLDVSAGFVAPVTALAVDAGRTRAARRTPRQADPALAAAAAFAAALQAQGVEVAGPLVRARAVPGAARLARVVSAPVGDVVELMLTESDNTVAEALARLVAARSGRPATFADAGVAVVDQVALVGIPVDGVRLTGGSGLGRSDLVPAGTLTATLVLAASEAHPELRPLLSGLPVAAVSGTLQARFTAPAEVAGRGVVRAKTGSLSGVNALAGVLTDADGRLLAFAVLADQSPATDAARHSIDAIAVQLARCGCR